MAIEEQNQPVHRGLKKGLYLIPSAFTAANIGMGFLAVLASLHGFQLAQINADQAAVYFDYAAKAIAFAILFDTLDGRVARMTKTATEIGVQLDSLADVLTFGIAPIVLAYGWSIGATFGEDNSMHGLGIFVLFMYLMCGTFRLARFNLQATRPRVLAQGTPKIDKKNFVGLPIPPAAGLVAAIVHFKPRPLNFYGENWSDFYTILIMILLAGLGLLMVSTIRYTSFKSVGVSRRSVYLILIIAAVGMLAWLYSRYVFLIIAAAYVSHGLIFYLTGLLRPSKKEAARTDAELTEETDR
ncbi:MAG: CDP-alcohol phosphatidyltransferase family protein [Pyrinomonadaceae bacterium]